MTTTRLWHEVKRKSIRGFITKEIFLVEEKFVPVQGSNPGATLSGVVALPIELTQGASNRQREGELVYNWKHI